MRGLTGGLTLGLAFGLSGRFSGGLAPWRLLGFLDDAHRLGVLRQTGAVYQFRHALLHDDLTATGRTSPTRRRRP